MPKNSSGFAFSQLIGCVLLAMTAALLLVSRSTVEMALESSILSLPQPLADGVQSIQSPTILLKWHQNLVDQRTLSNLQFSGLYDFLIDGSVSIFVSRVVFKGAANHGCPSCIGG